jgi:regulator of sirC expression with transglutaminase-like and TPR domain/Flp pilus assembly protein TadD
MRALWLISLLFSATVFCGEAAPPSTPSPAASTVAIPVDPVTPAAETTLLDRVIALNTIQEPELDSDKLRGEFAALVEKVRAGLEGKKTPREKIAVFNTVLLADRKVQYLSNKYWRDATLSASVLRAQGNCLSTSTLYVLVAHALELPVKMVLIPGHAFARWDDGAERINIETTSGGAEIPDARYFARGQQPAPDDAARLRLGESLTESEFVGELTRVAARHRVGENRLEDALKLFDAAQELLPGRPDLALERIETNADATGERARARTDLLRLMSSPEYAPLPSSVAVGALTFLAKDAAAEGDHARERAYLLSAFATAPKSAQIGTLMQLAFCYRALKDFHGAVRVMELAAVLEPQNPGVLYNLAILQKCDGQLPEALATIRTARKINPESWNLHILEAGYLVLNGNRDEGMQLYSTLEKPHGEVEFWLIMQAWFRAATGQREQFYDCFETALKEARSTSILEWIDQDPDLDPFRSETRFQTLVRDHRARLTNK